MPIPKEGSQAPDFDLPASSGGNIALKDLRGKELYASAGLVDSASSTCCTVAEPFCHSTFISRSSASVRV